MSDNLMDDVAMDLDLNQEPSVEPPSSDLTLGLGSLLSNLETAHIRIEERIRQLEAVTARAWQRHRWRNTQNTSLENTGNVSVSVDDSEVQVLNRGSVSELTIERGKGCKRDSSHLVAKALEMDFPVNKVENDKGGFFDCNICLDMAKEPILTCCGHLFCWPCFYQLPFADSTSKECPVCKGEVADSTVTPIYGSADGESVTELESGLKIPPRPKARRVESARQQRVAQGMTHGFSHIPVAEALRRIRNSIGLGQHQQQDTGGVSVTFVNNSPQVLQSSGSDSLNSRRLRSRLFSRVLSEGAASLSSELDSAQQMFEDLAASLTDRLLERGNASVLPAVNEDGDSFRRDAAIIQSEASSAPSSSQANGVSENLSTDAPISQSSLASRRRSILERLSDVDVRAARRRRLN